jgi:histidinol dehydrogenase
MHRGRAEYLAFQLFLAVFARLGGVEARQTRSIPQYYGIVEKMLFANARTMHVQDKAGATRGGY